MTFDALVLFSGGQDSTTCLAWALERFGHVETIGFDYGQRHAVELHQRPLVLERIRTLKSDWDLRLGMDHVLDLGVLGQISDTALTSGGQIRMSATGLPNTFVPGRNLMFLALAAALAYRRGLGVLVGGMCETDYSGYPDCRDVTIQAMANAISLGMDVDMVIETPLMWIDKAQTWALAESLGGEALTDLIIESTHTCYLGERVLRHPWGYGCGSCPACLLRAEGFARWSTHRNQTAAIEASSAQGGA